MEKYGKKQKVIIIGAGPAGLTAAVELSKLGYAVQILEAGDRIGGISQTVRFEGNRMDIGGHRFFTKDARVAAWWEALMPLQGSPAWDDLITKADKNFSAHGPDPEQADRVMLLRERVSRIYFNRHFFDYPISLKWSTIRGMGFLTTMKAGFSYLFACVHKLPESSLENFYINRFGRVLYSLFFESYTEKLWGRHPRDISADWGAQRVKGLSVKAVLKDIFRRLFHTKGPVETSLIEQFHYPKLGPGQLWELAAQEAVSLGTVLQLNSPVTGLQLEQGRVQAVYVRDTRIEGDIFLSSMPLQQLIQGLDGYSVSPTVLKAAQELPYRDFVTVGLLVHKLLLANDTARVTVNDRIPDCWIYVQDRGVKLGRVQLFNNWSPYMVEDPQEYVWLGLEYFCKEGDALWTMSDAEWTELGVKELRQIGILGDTPIIKSHVERIQKAYPAYFDGYAHINDIQESLNGIENLYCIGRNGQHRYNNMDHSMATAFAAVDAIEGRGSKEAVWQVNTEQSFHESK